MHLVLWAPVYLQILANLCALRRVLGLFGVFFPGLVLSAGSPEDAHLNQVLNYGHQGVDNHGDYNLVAHISVPVKAVVVEKA
jgi:hypothetical protein